MLYVGLPGLYPLPVLWRMAPTLTLTLTLTLTVIVTLTVTVTLTLALTLTITLTLHPNPNPNLLGPGGGPERRVEGLVRDEVVGGAVPGEGEG